MVSDNTAILVDGSGSLVPANWVAFDVLSFHPHWLDGGTVCATWGGAGACIPGDCYGVPATRSVTTCRPSLASRSASWGEDDMWDVGLRYAGEFNGFKLAATVVYAESSGAVSSSFGESDYLQAGAYVQHVGTGLFGLVNYGNIEDTSATGLASGGDGETWYFKAGLRQRLDAARPHGALR